VLFSPENIFRFFKYAIYILLTYNAVLFFQADDAAVAETYDTISWRNMIEAYSAGFDTAAWVVLLLVFELETAVIPDHLLMGRLKWLLKGLSTMAYLFIVYAFYGYCVKLGVVTDVVPFVVDDICGLIGTDYTYVATLDEYMPLDHNVCAVMNGQPLMQITGTEIIGTQEALRDATRLAVVDVVNASDWLVIVALLEIEVFMQLKDTLTDRIMSVSKYIKGFFYLILFICAAYWGFEGSFLDFWDAFLWLLAFIFIELNIFQWHSESGEEREQLLAV
jgi:hypothetical protein